MQGGDRLGDVAIDSQLALDDRVDQAVLSDHERHASGRQPSAQALDAVGAGDGAAAIAHQRVREVVRVGERGMGGWRIEAHADNFGVERRDFRPAIAEAARFPRSARGEILGEEIEDHVAPAAEVAQAELPAVGEIAAEIRSRLAGRDHFAFFVAAGASRASSSSTSGTVRNPFGTANSASSTVAGVTRTTSRPTMAVPMYEWMRTGNPVA